MGNNFKLFLILKYNVLKQKKKNILKHEKNMYGFKINQESFNYHDEHS
jgi:hypothetical protein